MHVLKWAFGRVCLCVCPSMCMYMYFRFPVPGCYSCCGISCYIIASISLGLRQYFFNAVLWHLSNLCKMVPPPPVYCSTSCKDRFPTLAQQNLITQAVIESKRERNKVLGRKGVSVKALGPTECRSTSHFHLLFMLFELSFYIKPHW